MSALVKLSSICAVALLALPVGGQNLVAFAVVSPGDREVGQVNPATGAVVLPGGPINGGASLSNPGGVGSADPTGNRYLFVGTPSGGMNTVYSVHSGTGAVIESHVLSGSPSTTINGLEYDDGEGVLYALANANGADRQLATIAIATGVVSPVPGSAPIAGVNLSTTGGADDIDVSGNRYFFIGQPTGGNNKIYSIDTANGAVLSSPDLGGASVNAILGLEWDAGESVLYALASVGAGGRQLATINVATGVVSLLGSALPGGSISSSGADSLDAAGDRYFFAGQPSGGNPKIYAISTVNGAAVTSPDLSGDSTSLLGLEWDPGPVPVELMGFRVE